MPPSIDEFPEACTTEEGRQVYFKVSLSGVPKPTYNWYHDGTLISEDYAHELHDDGSLLIITVESSHKGIYRLVANNSAGTTDKQVELSIVSEGSKEMMGGAEGGANSIGPIPVNEFGEFVANGHAKSNKEFKVQYNVSSFRNVLCFYKCYMFLFAYLYSITYFNTYYMLHITCTCTYNYMLHVTICMFI